MSSYYSIAANKDELCERAAEHWLQCYKQTLLSKDSFCVALSGGSTPKNLYQLLANKKYQHRINWGKVQIFFGDERCVPLGHADSNYLMAKQALFDHIDIPTSNIHPINFDKKNPARSANVYQAQISEILINGETGVPEFDLLLLGMGDDGHTASLFPDTTILQEKKRLVAEVYVNKLGVWRVSVTYPIINNAKNIMLLVSGKSKAEKISDIFNGNSKNARYPIQAIEPEGDMLWLLDSDAATGLEYSRVSSAISKIA